MPRVRGRRNWPAKNNPSRFSWFKLAKSQNFWSHYEIPHFALSTGPCPSCIVNLDGPCQRLQQFHHPRNTVQFGHREVENDQVRLEFAWLQAIRSTKWRPIRGSQPRPKESASALPKSKDYGFQKEGGRSRIERGTYSPLFFFSSFLVQTQAHVQALKFARTIRLHNKPPRPTDGLQFKEARAIRVGLSATRSAPG